MKKDWTYKKLGEVADTYRGLTYSKKDEVEHSSKAVLRSNNIDLTSHQLNFDEIKYIREDFVIPQDKLVKKDSIFICMSNGSMQHLGKVAYIDKEYNFAFGGFMGLVVPKEIVNAKYVYYSMLADNFLSTIMKEGKGANINNLRFSDVENYLIPIPPLSIQHSIVSELDLLHSLIEKKQEQLRALDNLAQSLFYQMFGDPITNPMGWEIKKLGEVFEIGSGGTPAKNKSEYWDNGDIPWIGSNMCQNSIVYRTDGKFITRSGLEHSSAKLLPSDTVLVALVGATIGKVALLKTPSATNQNIAFIKSHEEFAPIFVFYHLMNQYEEFMNIGNGDFKMATQGFIKGLPIILPPLSLQQSFATKVSAIEEQKRFITQSIKDVESLLAQRMDHYFG